MATLAQFTRDVYPALSEMIYSWYNRYSAVYPLIMNVKPTDRWYEEHQTEVDYGLFAQTNEGENYHQDEMFLGFYTRYQLAKYTKYFRVTEDLDEFGKYIKMGDRSKSMGRKAKASIEVLTHTVYNNSFVTNLADAVPLFSTAHPGYTGSGTTFANVLSTQASLSFTSYQSVISSIKTTTDERGVLIMQQPKKLVVHPNNELVAREILRSAGRPDTANRADNKMPEVAPGVELVVDPWLTSSSMWWVQCDQHYVYAYEHGGLKTRPERDPFNGDFMVFGKFYLSYGASHYLGLYAGSQ